MYAKLTKRNWNSITYEQIKKEWLKINKMK